MSKTVAQLANAAIRTLGITPLSTETYAYVTQMVDPLLDELKGRNIVEQSTTSISERNFYYLADLLAFKVMDEFADQVVTDKQLLMGRVAVAENALRDMQRGKTAS